MTAKIITEIIILIIFGFFTLLFGVFFYGVLKREIKGEGLVRILSRVYQVLWGFFTLVMCFAMLMGIFETIQTIIKIVNE